MTRDKNLFDGQCKPRSGAESGNDEVQPDGVDVTEVVMNSPLLAWLVEDVRNGQLTEYRGYDRFHRRHNRS